MSPRGMFDQPVDCRHRCGCFRVLSKNTNELVLPLSSVATPRLNTGVSCPACVGERH